MDDIKLTRKEKKFLKLKRKYDAAVAARAKSQSTEVTSSPILDNRINKIKASVSIIKDKVMHVNS